MTDMTAEQAFEIVDAELRRDIPAGGSQVVRAWGVIRQALTSPRVPEGWKLAGHVAVCEDGSVFYEYFTETADGISAAMAADGWEGMSVQPVYMLTAAPAPAETVAQSVQDEPSRLPAVWIQPGMLNLRLIAAPGERAEVSAHCEPDAGFTVPLYAAPSPADATLIDEGNIGQVSDSDELYKLRERIMKYFSALDKANGLSIRNPWTGNLLNQHRDVADAWRKANRIRADIEAILREGGDQ